MQVEFLKQIVGGIAGQGSEGIVDILHNKKDVNEFLIAKKLNLTINQTRNILYSLGDEGLVSFIRKKDKKKGGWYTYFWTLDTFKALTKFKEVLLSDLEKLKNSLNSRSTQRFFYCKNCEIEFSEESALTRDYTCPECGEILELKQNDAEVEALKGEFERLTKVLEQVDEELAEVAKKEEKSRQRRIKAHERKKAKEKAERAKKRKAAREKKAKEEGKKPKKKTKKKTKKKKSKKTKKKKSKKKSAKKTKKKSTKKKATKKKTTKKSKKKSAKKTKKKSTKKKATKKTKKKGVKKILGKAIKKIAGTKK